MKKFTPHSGLLWVTSTSSLMWWPPPGAGGTLSPWAGAWPPTTAGVTSTDSADCRQVGRPRTLYHHMYQLNKQSPERDTSFRIKLRMFIPINMKLLQEATKTWLRSVSSRRRSSSPEVTSGSRWGRMSAPGRCSPPCGPPPAPGPGAPSGPGTPSPTAPAWTEAITRGSPTPVQRGCNLSRPCLDFSDRWRWHKK